MISWDLALLQMCHIWSIRNRDKCMWNRCSVKNSKYRIKVKAALFQKYYGFKCWLHISTFFCYWLMCRTGSSRAVFVFSESVFQINLTSSLFLLSFPSQVFPCYAIEFLSHCSFFWSVREKKMQHPHMGLNILFCRPSFFRDVSDSFKVLKFFLWGCWSFFQPSWEYSSFHVFEIEFSFSFLLLEEN